MIPRYTAVARCQVCFPLFSHHPNRFIFNVKFVMSILVFCAPVPPYHYALFSHPSQRSACVCLVLLGRCCVLLVLSQHAVCFLCFLNTPRVPKPFLLLR